MYVYILCESPCSAAPRCKTPSHPHYDRTDLKNHPYRIGEVLTIKCLPDYHLVGNDVVKCGQDGNWFPPLPGCKVKPTTVSETNADSMCANVYISPNCTCLVSGDTVRKYVFANVTIQHNTVIRIYNFPNNLFA